MELAIIPPSSKRGKQSPKSSKPVVIEVVKKPKKQLTATQRANRNQRRRTSKVAKSISNKLVRTGRSGGERGPNFQEVGKILKGIMDPKNAGDVRLPVDWNATRTTCMNPFTRPAVPFVSSVPGTCPNFQYLPVTEWMAFSFRNPLCSNIFYDPNQGNSQYSYNMYGLYGFDVKETPPALSWSIAPSAGFAATSKRQLQIPYGIASSAYKPHKNTWYAGALGTRPGRFFWLETADVFLINSVAVGGVGTVIFSLDHWDPDAGISENVIVANGPIAVNTAVTTTLTVPAAGYYAAAIGPSLTTPPTYTAITVNSCQVLSSGNPTARNGVWCHQCMPDFDKIVQSTPAIKLNGVSMMYTNTDPLLYKGGSFAALQVPPGRHWTEFIYSPVGGTLSALPGLGPAPSPTAGYGLLAGFKDAYADSLVEGSYQWMKPVESADFGWLEYYDLDEGVFFDSHWPLDKETGFGALAITGPLTALSGYITMAFCTEATTTDTTRPTDIATGDPLLVYELQGAIRHLPQYSHNPDHLSMIIAALKNGVSWVADHIISGAPKAVSAAKFVRNMLN